MLFENYGKPLQIIVAKVTKLLKVVAAGLSKWDCLWEIVQVAEYGDICKNKTGLDNGSKLTFVPQYLLLISQTLWCGYSKELSVLDNSFWVPTT